MKTDSLAKVSFDRSYALLFGCRIPDARPRCLPGDGLLESQGVAAILVIGRMSAELPVAALMVTGNGAVIGFMDFQPDRPALAGPRPIFGGVEKQRGDTASAHVRRDCDRVEARQPRPSPKEHDRRSGKTPISLGNKDLGGRRVEEVTQAAAREPIGGKHPMLKLDQGIH